MTCRGCCGGSADDAGRASAGSDGGLDAADPGARRQPDRRADVGGALVERAEVERRLGPECDGDHVAVVNLGQADDAGERRFHRGEVAPVARVVAEQVDRHDAVRRERRRARAVERRRVEHRAAGGGVVEIDLQRVDGPGIGRVLDPGHRIHLKHRQPLVVRRQLEHACADRDDFRVQFDRGHPRFREFAVAELGQRGAAQAELGQVARRVEEQHPRHHLLRVFEFQPVRLAQPHRALYPLGVEMQVAHAFQFGNRYRGVARLARRPCLAVAAGAVGAVGIGFNGFSADQHGDGEAREQGGGTCREEVVRP